MKHLTSRFQKIFKSVGISKGTKRTALQYSYEELTPQRIERLLDFYFKADRPRQRSIGYFKEDLRDINPRHSVYIWVTKDSTRTVLHGYAILDHKGELVKKEISLSILDAQIVNFCTDELLKEG